MLQVTYSLNSVLMIAAPAFLGLYLVRRFGVSWKLFGIGAVTFIASQMAHFLLVSTLMESTTGRALPPFLEAHPLLVNAVMIGLAAGLCEEIARFLVYRHWITSARTWKEALMFGAGHGGAEAILLGVIAGVQLATMISWRHVHPTSLPVPTSQQANTAQSIAQFWSVPWYDTLLGAVDRVFMMCIQISMAVLVLQAVKREQIVWLVVAILWHALIGGTALAVASTWGLHGTELVIGMFAAASLAIIFALRPRAPEPHLPALRST